MLIKSQPISGVPYKNFLSQTCEWVWPEVILCCLPRKNTTVKSRPVSPLSISALILSRSAALRSPQSSPTILWLGAKRGWADHSARQPATVRRVARDRGGGQLVGKMERGEDAANTLDRPWCSWRAAVDNIVFITTSLFVRFLHSMTGKALYLQQTTHFKTLTVNINFISLNKVIVWCTVLTLSAR